MTRKDYNKLAELIKKNVTAATLRQDVIRVIAKGTFMNDLCNYLQEDNPKFNEVKFREATGEIVNQEQ